MALPLQHPYDPSRYELRKMPNRSFVRNKMRWLNAVCSDHDVSSTTFRVAYVIADHINSVSGDAWPSYNRVATRLGISSKTIQRACQDLERRHWLYITRSASKRTNRYRLRWPHETASETEADVVLMKGQVRSMSKDTNVPQSYSSNLLKTSSTATLRKDRFPDRGTYEQQIIRRFGYEAEQLLSSLQKYRPEVVDRLCQAEKEGNLHAAEIHAARLFLLSIDQN